MAQLPPKIPTLPSWSDFSSDQKPHSAAVQPPSSAAANNNNNHPSWVDEFLDFSSARRGTHRRSASDSIAFLETPLMTLDDDCRGGGRSNNTGGNNNNHHLNRQQQHDFDKFDDEQFMSMFSVDDMSSNPGGSNSDHDSINDDKEAATTTGQSEDNSQQTTPSNGDNSGDRIFDPKRVKRILANRQSAQRSRVRKLQYISELERSVTSLQAEVSVLSPRVAFLDHQRLLLNVDNSAIKQRIAALAQDKIFKDAHQEALKREIERLRQIYQHQNQKKMDQTEQSNNNNEPTPITSTVDQKEQQLLQEGDQFSDLHDWQKLRSHHHVQLHQFGPFSF